MLLCELSQRFLAGLHMFLLARESYPEIVRFGSEHIKKR
jgi:hypothetical protein